jgi:hypothetical protein
MMEGGHTPLRQEDVANLESARSWVRGHFTERATEKYATEEGKLRVIDAILSNGGVSPEETSKLESLGVAFGDALAERLPLEWVLVSDEYGSEPALHWPGTSIHVHPLSMILRRVESTEDIAVHELFEETCSRLRELAASGRHGQS